MTLLSSRRVLLLGLSSMLFVAGAASAGLFGRSTPDDLDLSRSRSTWAGLYLAEIAPVTEPVTVGPMHAWTVTLETAGGAPVDAATIGIDGGMPQHRHGLPTAPAVTDSLGDGRFLVEGVRFNMPGWWVLDLTIDGPEGRDTVTFNLVL